MLTMLSALDTLPPSSHPRPGWVALISGPSGVYRFAHELLGRQLLLGQCAVVLDGANRFDPLTLARTAQAAKRPPSATLDRVRVSRAWTCYQYLSLLQQVEPVWQPSPSTLLVLLGPLDLFIDEDVALPDAQRTWMACRRELARLTGRGGVLIVSKPPDAWPAARQSWWKDLLLLTDERWLVEPHARVFDRRLPPSSYTRPDEPRH